MEFIKKDSVNFFNEIFKDYDDIVSPKQLKKMLGVGTNKTYTLLKNNEIYNKKIGNNYFIPKLSVVEYLMKN